MPITQRMRVEYNAPFVLTFTLICCLIYGFDLATSGWLTAHLFPASPELSLIQPVSLLRLFLHVAGHADGRHLFTNLSIILLIGPVLEEKYGSVPLLVMSLITAFVTGLLNAILFSAGILGASGIVFMLILLGSITNVRSGVVPLTFILVLILYLGNEIGNAFREDNISQFAHIIGGLCGSGFGFLFPRRH